MAAILVCKFLYKIGFNWICCKTRFVASADQTLLPRGSETGINYQEDYEFYFKYLHKGLHSNKRSVLDLFKTWNGIFYPGSLDDLTTPMPSQPGDETLGALIDDLEAEEEEESVARETNAPHTRHDPGTRTSPAPIDNTSDEPPTPFASQNARNPAAFHNTPTPFAYRNAPRNTPTPFISQNARIQLTPRNTPTPFISENARTQVTSHSTPCNTSSSGTTALTPFASQNMPTSFANPTAPTQSPVRNMSHQFTDTAPGAEHVNGTTAPAMVSVLNFCQIVKLTGAELIQREMFDNGPLSPLTETSNTTHSPRQEPQLSQQKPSKTKRTQVGKKRKVNEENHPQEPSQRVRRSVRARRSWMF